MAPGRDPLALYTKAVIRAGDTLPTPDEWKARSTDKNKYTAYHAQEHLAILGRGEKIPRWRGPKRWAVIDEVPKTSVGKFDKKVLRARYAEGGMEVTTLG